MKQQEFVTLYGKATIERDILFLRNMDVPLTRTNFFRVCYELFFIAIFVLSFFKTDGPGKYISVLGWGFVLLFRFTEWFDIFFRRSYANRIPLNRINSFTTEPDQFGVNTNVRLHLTNGRYRIIPFRTMEKQYEAFIERISHQIAPTQFA
jgi:hypothetical protein